jgi:hypothetical protein
MNHTLAGPEERWQQEIDWRVTERLLRAREERARDEARLAQLQRIFGGAHSEAIAMSRGIIWGIGITAVFVAVVTAAALLQRFHF